MSAPAYELLISVVRRGRGDLAAKILRDAGARGGTIIYGRGAAQNKFLRLLCLADTAKELIFTLSPAKETPRLINALKTAPNLCKHTPGVGFTIPATSIFHSGSPILSNNSLPDNSLWEEAMPRELICVVVNAGYADDIMAAAREAGATGGTIINARGTGTAKDNAFFGLTIVPEKEMLLVLAKKEAVPPIVAAIKACPCLAEPGVGIVFQLPAKDFFPLGLKANSTSR